MFRPVCNNPNCVRAMSVYTHSSCCSLGLMVQPSVDAHSWGAGETCSVWAEGRELPCEDGCMWRKAALRTKPLWRNLV